jgi:hypothetical protein
VLRPCIKKSTIHRKLSKVFTCFLVPQARTAVAMTASIETTNVGETKEQGEFAGDIAVNQNLPTKADITKVEDLLILDADGTSRPFKSLYSGENVAKRVLVIFIRHFFCGVSSSTHCLVTSGFQGRSASTGTVAMDALIRCTRSQRDHLCIRRK